MNEWGSTASGNRFAIGPRGRSMRAFIETTEDLRRRSALTASHYDVTQAAALIRRLLMDKSPLGVSIAAYFELSLDFVWSHDTNVVGDGAERFLIAGSGLAPELKPAHPGYDRVSQVEFMTGTRDAFLAAPVVEFSSSPSEHASVKDVVRVYAHELGGVHWHLERHNHALEIVEEARTRAPRHLDWSMIAISRVVYHALEPALNRASAALFLADH